MLAAAAPLRALLPPLSPRGIAGGDGTAPESVALVADLRRAADELKAVRAGANHHQQQVARALAQVNSLQSKV